MSPSRQSRRGIDFYPPARCDGGNGAVDAENLWTGLSAHARCAAGMVRGGPGGTGGDRRRGHAEPTRLPRPRVAGGGRAARRRRRRGCSGSAVVAEQHRVPRRDLRLRPARRACRPHQHALSRGGSRQHPAPVARGRAGDGMGVPAGRLSGDFRRTAAGGSRRSCAACSGYFFLAWRNSPACRCCRSRAL